MLVNHCYEEKFLSKKGFEMGSNGQDIESKLRGLFICFCDLSKATSGSTVRPSRMVGAFKELSLTLDVVEGTNRFCMLDVERKMRAREALDQIGRVHYDFCYIELPAGPLFHGIYRRIIRKVSKSDIPIGAFYRDGFWIYPDLFKDDSSIWTRLKWLIIKYLHLRDISIFNEYIDILYLSTLQFMRVLANTVKLGTETRLLPPGCTKLFDSDGYASDVRRLEEASEINLLYIGGANKNYGIDLLLDAVAIVNKTKYLAKLIVICPEQMWAKYLEEKGRIDLNTTEVISTYGENLDIYYAQADIGVIPFRTTAYNRLAMPIKLCEYISHAKPILATDCDEIATFIRDNQIGWVVPDTAEALADEIIRLNQNREEIVKRKESCITVVTRHSWENRCKTILHDLVDTE